MCSRSGHSCMSPTASHRSGRFASQRSKHRRRRRGSFGRQPRWRQGRLCRPTAECSSPAWQRNNCCRYTIRTTRETSWICRIEPRTRKCHQMGPSSPDRRSRCCLGLGYRPTATCSRTGHSRMSPTASRRSGRFESQRSKHRRRRRGSFGRQPRWRQERLCPPTVERSYLRPHHRCHREGTGRYRDPHAHHRIGCPPLRQEQSDWAQRCSPVRNP